MESQIKNLSISTFSKFSKQKITEAKRFVSTCKRLDRCTPIFYWNSIADRRNPGINEILISNPEKAIVAYIALYHFEEKEVEITIAAHPDYRTTALYALMWDEIKRAVGKYPIPISRFTFTCNEKQPFLKEYLIQLGAHCSQYTYKLQLSAAGFAKIPMQGSLPIDLRSATDEDIPALLHLEKECFQIPEAIYTEHLLQKLKDPQEDIIMAVQGDRVVGKLHIQTDKTHVFLYDFCVDPVDQGKGIGGYLLYGVLKKFFAHNTKKVFIDVINIQDLNWYKKFQFTCAQIYEHWKLAAIKNPVKEREKQLDTLLLNFHSPQVQDQLSPTFYKH